jgi:transcriptional regulator with XRE-family HTH domain
MATGITINGSVLRELRENRFWSQADLASHSREFAWAEGDRQCGLSRETVSKLERQSRTPSPRTLRYLVGALRPPLVDLRRLLLDREPPEALVDLTRVDPSDLHYVTVLLSDLAVADTLQDEPEPAARSVIEAVGLATVGGLLLNVERIRGVRALMPDWPASKTSTSASPEGVAVPRTAVWR